MGYLSTMLVLAALLTGGLLVLGMKQDTRDVDRVVSAYHFKHVAREAALTGLNLTARKLAADGGPWTNGASYSFLTTSFGGGSFTVLVTSEGADSVRATSIGNAGGATYHAYAKYRREFADGGLPPVFQNTITTDNYIQLSGNVYVGALNRTYNASIHTNGTLQTNGNAFRVEGYGTYTGGLSSDQWDNFEPNVDYNGDDPNVHPADSVHIPAPDMAALRGQGHVIAGDFVLDGNTTPTVDFSWWGAALTAEGYPDVMGDGTGNGTEGNPFVLYVEGDLYLQHRIELTGHGVLVATGTVFIEPLGNGGGVVGGLDGAETRLLIVSPGAIDVAGNAEIRATLFGWDEIAFQGTPNVTGGIIAKRASFSGGGSPTILFAPPSETITDPGFEHVVPIGPVLIAFSEW